MSKRKVEGVLLLSMLAAAGAAAWLLLRRKKVVVTTPGNEQYSEPVDSDGNKRPVAGWVLTYNAATGKREWMPPGTIS